MKKLSFFVLILVLALLLGGCMRLEVEMKINDNGKADISMIYAMSDAFGSMSESDSDSMMSDEDVEEYKKKGWTVSAYAVDGYTGYRMSKQNTELDDLLLIEDADSKIEKNGSTYKVDLNVFSSESMEDFGSVGSMIKASGGSVAFRVILPRKPVSHNATKVSDDGKTLEWDLLTMKSSDHIKFEFKTGSFPWWIFLILAVLVIAAVVAFLLLRKKKSAALQEDVPFILDTEGYGSAVPPTDVPQPGYAAPATDAPQTVYSVPAGSWDVPEAQEPLTQAESQNVQAPEVPQDFQGIQVPQAPQAAMDVQAAVEAQIPQEPRMSEDSQPQPLQAPEVPQAPADVKAAAEPQTPLPQFPDHGEE